MMEFIDERVFPAGAATFTVTIPEFAGGMPVSPDEFSNPSLRDDLPRSKIFASPPREWAAHSLCDYFNVAPPAALLVDVAATNEAGQALYRQLQPTDATNARILDKAKLPLVRLLAQKMQAKLGDDFTVSLADERIAGGYDAPVKGLCIYVSINERKYPDLDEKTLRGIAQAHQVPQSNFTLNMEKNGSQFRTMHENITQHAMSQALEALRSDPAALADFSRVHAAEKARLQSVTREPA